MAFPPQISSLSNDEDTYCLFLLSFCYVCDNVQLTDKNRQDSQQNSYLFVHKQRLIKRLIIQNRCQDHPNSKKFNRWHTNNKHVSECPATELPLESRAEETLNLRPNHLHNYCYKLVGSINFYSGSIQFRFHHATCKSIVNDKIYIFFKFFINVSALLLETRSISALFHSET